ncbi:hypothetical protein BD779DRAFT_1041290 [Infundibulicybe gibba]|nr:hypothetical protein BD779DRAFT_1041290 [Infundibulicybe gibba]
MSSNLIGTHPQNNVSPHSPLGHPIPCITSPEHSWSPRPSGPWDAFNFAPSSKLVRPATIHSTNGSVQNAAGLVHDSAGVATLSGSGSYLVLDFSKEVGGILSLNVEKTAPGAALSLSFTESPVFISPTHSDDSCRTSLQNNPMASKHSQAHSPLGHSLKR